MRVLKAGIAGVLAAVALAALATGTGAVAQPPPSATTFTGKCHYEGRIIFDDPIGGVPEPNGLRMGASGTCSGWLDGQPVDEAPVWFYGSAEGLMSCTQGLPMGTGGLVFDDDEVISYTFAEYRITGAGKVEFRGVSGGSLHGVGAADDDTAEQVERCAEGDGSLEQTSISGDVAGTISG